MSTLETLPWADTKLDLEEVLIVTGVVETDFGKFYRARVSLLARPSYPSRNRWFTSRREADAVSYALTNLAEWLRENP